MTGSMDAHARTRELAAIALDFPLEPAEEAELESHVADCEPCRAFATALRRDIAMVAALPEVDAPARVRRRVLGRTARIATSPRMLLAPLAAVLVLVVAVTPLALQFLFRSSGAASTPGPSSPAASSEPTRAPTLGPTPPLAEWHAATLAAGPGDTAVFPNLESVTYLPGGGFVVVGESCPGDRDPAEPCLAFVATSSDGARWLTSDPPNLELEPLPGDVQVGMRDVVPGGPGVVAVGVTAVDGEPYAAVWLSPSGRSWERAPDDVSFSGAWMNAVIATSDGSLVAVGGRTDGDGNVEATAWTSPDGLDWTAVAAPAAGALGAGSDAVTHDGRTVAGASDVAERPQGGLTAVGATCDSTGCHGVAWTLSGQSWSRRAAEFDGLPVAIATDADRVNAVGRTEQAAAWTSEDGVTWKPITSLPDTGFRELNALVETSDLWLTSGSPAEIWVSSDGLDWMLLAPLSEQFGVGQIRGLASGGGVFVAVGIGADGIGIAFYTDATSASRESP